MRSATFTTYTLVLLLSCTVRSLLRSAGSAGSNSTTEGFESRVTAASSTFTNFQLPSLSLPIKGISTEIEGKKVSVDAITSSAVPTVKSTLFKSLPPTSSPTVYKHGIQILPKFKPSRSPVLPPSTNSFLNPQVRFYTPINYFVGNNPPTTTPSSLFKATEMANANLNEVIK